MDIPFVLKFLKNIELFQDLNKLDKIFFDQLNELRDKKTKVIPLWEAEKKILFWTYYYHKHLGSPLRISTFKNYITTNKDNNYFSLIEGELKESRKVFGNLVSRGYATFFPKESVQGNCEGIIFTRQGLDMGGLIKKICIISNIDLNNKMKIYQEKTGAKKYLKRNNWNLLYWFYYIVAWVALIKIILFIFKEFFYII